MGYRTLHSRHQNGRKAWAVDLPRWKAVVLAPPHLLLGNLTLREMLFFTPYHQLHHVEVVERKRVAAA